MSKAFDREDILLRIHQRGPIKEAWIVTRNRVKRFPLQVRHACQRVVRGWDDSALWSLDNHLTTTLGQQLVKMSEIVHGYTPGYDGAVPIETRTEDSQFIADDPDNDESFNRWKADLLKHGEALQVYGAKQYTVYGEEWDAVYLPAREALHWVAEYLGSLWD